MRRQIATALAYLFLLSSVVGAAQGDDDRFYHGLILCWLASITARQEEARGRTDG